MVLAADLLECVTHRVEEMVVRAQNGPVERKLDDSLGTTDRPCPPTQIRQLHWRDTLEGLRERASNSLPSLSIR
jgi:hypothetical protein